MFRCNAPYLYMIFNNDPEYWDGLQDILHSFFFGSFICLQKLVINEIIPNWENIIYFRQIADL